MVGGFVGLNSESPGYEREPCPDCSFDKYGNPLNGDRLINCCFPDCGCDGERLCMAENGSSDRARSQNVEGMWAGKAGLKGKKAIADLLVSIRKEES